jgi:cysteine-rich repeat protein
MRPISLVAALCAAAAVALVACSVEAVTFTQGAEDTEDCGVPGDEDGNGLADCDDPACAGATPCQPACGNGRPETGEGCDDGNPLDGDGCDTNCMVTGCGNGIQTSNEVCDDGNVTSNDGCDNNCTVTGCGNDVLTGTEVCDDGNLTNNDGCDSNCTATACGNDVLAGTEVCDDGNLTDNDGCDSNCTPTSCHNGVVTAEEQCDDGNTSNTDGCVASCVNAQCGDSFLRAGLETCDDGNAVTEVCPYEQASCTVCNATCQAVPGQTSRCGDNIVQAGSGEQCDDGNIVNGDGCDNNCTLSRGHAVPANPAVWLRFDDPPGDGVIDSGAGHTAACSSCPAQVPGVFGGAYAFTPGNQVDVAAAPDLGPGTAFTVAAWVRFDTQPTNTTVIGCKNVSTNDCTYALLTSSARVPTFHSSTGTQAPASTPLALGTWHHIAMTWNGASRVGYVDGVVVTTVTAPMVNDVATVLSIGARNYSPLPLTFSGSIDDFLFYNRVLSAAELIQLATP